MPANVYIRAAVTQLRDAAAALQDEARQVQTDAYNAESQLDSDISSMQNELTMLRMEARTTSDLSHRAALEGRVRVLEQQVAAKKDALSRQSTDAARVVQSKTGLADNVQNAISSLESLSVSAG